MSGNQGSPPTPTCQDDENQRQSGAERKNAATAGSRASEVTGRPLSSIHHRIQATKIASWRRVVMRAAHHRRRLSSSSYPPMQSAMASSKSEPFHQESPQQQHQSAPTNVLQWLEMCCPREVVPKILAFAGPQLTATLAKTNRYWRSLLQAESTWRTLCEELYKWKPGDPKPTSWAEYYRMNPCVPVDWTSISKALRLARENHPFQKFRRSQRSIAQIRSIRILLRPAVYYLNASITVETLRQHNVTIQTMDLPENLFWTPPLIREQQIRLITEAPLTPPPTRSPRSIMSLLSCRHVEDVVTSEPAILSENYEPDLAALSLSSYANAKRATVVLRSRKANEPAFCVRQGNMVLRNLDILHHCDGLDIWNGNAALQVQPIVTAEDNLFQALHRPTASLERVRVTSYSGRGVVNIGGGLVQLSHCIIEDCAATGLYIGGPGSEAIVEQSDVVNNGLGNPHRRMGIARGHSGIYLEQGTARITDCNVSHNSLTGITSVSTANSILTLERSDLVGNGSNQLELPPLGTVARDRSLTIANRISAVGIGRMRTCLVAGGGTKNHRMIYCTPLPL